MTVIPSKQKVLLTLILIIAAAFPAFAHDLFLKLDDFFVAINERVTVKILNGSFMSSDGAVRFERLADLSLSPHRVVDRNQKKPSSQTTKKPRISACSPQKAAITWSVFLQ